MFEFHGIFSHSHTLGASCFTLITYLAQLAEMENSLGRGSSLIQELNNCPAIDLDRKLQMQYSILTVSTFSH